jgi:hypothetical protein
LGPGLRGARLHGDGMCPNVRRGEAFRPPSPANTSQLKQSAVGVGDAVVIVMLMAVAVLRDGITMCFAQRMEMGEMIVVVPLRALGSLVVDRVRVRLVQVAMQVNRLGTKAEAKHEDAENHYSERTPISTQGRLPHISGIVSFRGDIELYAKSSRPVKGLPASLSRSRRRSCPRQRR